MDGRGWSYQIMLRAVGAWLDERQPAYFTIFETPEGFTVIAVAPGPDPAPEEAHFHFGSLSQQHDALRQYRGRPRIHPVDSWLSVPGTRQDFLHALGFELDDAGAEMVVIGQLADSVVLSYAFVNPSAGFSWHKRMVLMQQPDIEALMKAARGRRRLEQSTGLFGGLRKQMRTASS